MATLFPPPAPALPEFRTLLLTGDFHASAPIHLCLSYVLQHDIAKAVLLAPSRARFATSLKESKDDWIRKHGGDGRTCKAASRVDVLYPPSPAHLSLLLSLFHEALFGKEDFLHNKTTFATSPSLIVLCELSSYFDQDPETTVSSYMMLVLQAISTASSLTAQTGKVTALAIFDSGLGDLRLPLLRPVSPGLVSENGQADSSSIRRESVRYLVQRYFEWTGIFEQDVMSPGAWQESFVTTLRSCSCRLRRVKRDVEDEDEEIVWQWREELSPSHDVIFSW